MLKSYSAAVDSGQLLIVDPCYLDEMMPGLRAQIDNLRGELLEVRMGRDIFPNALLLRTGGDGPFDALDIARLLLQALPPISACVDCGKKPPLNWVHLEWRCDAEDDWRCPRCHDSFVFWEEN